MTNLRKIFLFIGDIISFYLALIITLKIGFWQEFNLKVFSQHFFPFSILYLLWLIIFYIFGLYDFPLLKNTSFLYLNFSIVLFLCFLVGAVFFYFFSFLGITPKTNLIFHLVILGFLIIIWRKILFSLFSSHFQRKIAFLGKHPEAEKLRIFLKENPQLGYKFVTFLNPEDKFLLKRVEKLKIDILVLASNSSHDFPFEKFFSSKSQLMDLIQAFELFLEKIPPSLINPEWILENVKEKETYEKVKRVIDFTLAFLILLATFPLWILIIFAIFLEDRGPIFYFQKRVGKEKRNFWLIKFRSMIPEAEKEGPKWASLKDERTTKVGRVLRRFHLDELPQMINVIKGELSLVGPRPERPEFESQLEKEIPFYNLRHLIKPGFTGWAQIKFRYARSIMDSFEKFQYDLYYLKNRSLLLDIRILLKTLNLFFRKE